MEKQFTCAQMGGPETCTTIFKAASPEEAVQKAMPHVTQEHPELAERIGKMTTEETSKWMEDFKAKFPSFPDAQ